MILVATSADADWTTWPLHNSYPPLMQQMVLQAASGRLAERNIRVGQPYDQSFPVAGASGAGDRGHAPGAAGRHPAEGAGGTSQLHFEQTDLSGAYQVRIGPPLAVEKRVRGQPRPGRERSGQARPDGPPGAAARLELRLFDQLARIDPKRRVGGPAGRASSPFALWCALPVASGVVPGLEVRPPRFPCVRSWRR